MEEVLFRYIDPYDIKYAIVKNGNGERIIDRIQELEQWAREQWGERTRIKRNLMRGLHGLDRGFMG